MVKCVKQIQLIGILTVSHNYLSIDEHSGNIVISCIKVSGIKELFFGVLGKIKATLELCSAYLWVRCRGI